MDLALFFLVVLVLCVWVFLFVCFLINLFIYFWCDIIFDDNMTTTTTQAAFVANSIE